MKQNESLNNTCILFDPNNEAQQKAIIKFYNDNGWYMSDDFSEPLGSEYLGVFERDFGYWSIDHEPMELIDLPKEYYTIEQSKFILTENNGETKPYYEVDKDGDKGYKTPIDNIVEDVKSEQNKERKPFDIEFNPSVGYVIWTLCWNEFGENEWVAEGISKERLIEISRNITELTSK